MSRRPVTAEQARALVPAFGLHAARVEPLGRGLINDTFAVDDDDGARFVLQRVHPVFDPRIHLNIAAVTEHLARRGLITPRLVPSREGRPWIEHEGEAWRLMTRVEGVSLDVVREPEQARAAAELLGRFHSALGDLDHEFVGLRQGVHDTPAHLRRLTEAVAEHQGHRLWAEVEPLARAIVARAERLPPLSGLRARPVHGDPKLDNVLFEAAQGPGSQRARCWIDLDTVAPMPLAVELGDAWRSWCNPRGENDARARFDLEIYRASLGGYRQGCTLPIDAAEREALLHGVEWITLELSARFAADALQERYFGWDRERFAAAGEHNLLRARGQWALHEAVLAVRAERRAALHEAWAGS
ncbi:MAG: phosphotransferase [Myxococcales bacterium]|nr:phosphotransferase [Myxococcales bacterium]